MAPVASQRASSDWEALYHQIGQIISEEPSIKEGNSRGSADVLRWLGRVEIIILDVNGLADHVVFARHRAVLLTAVRTDAESQMRHIRSMLYTALAKAEMNSPSAARGAFIPAGSAFDALLAISGIFRECSGSVLVVDPYLDSIALTDFLPMVPEGVPLRLLASGKQKTAGLPECVERWKMQFGGSRPIELRLAAPRLLHDRLIMDDSNVWSISQSFNAIAQRSPAMVQRVGADIALAKRQAFKELWEGADPA